MKLHNIVFAVLYFIWIPIIGAQASPPKAYKIKYSFLQNGKEISVREIAITYFNQVAYLSGKSNKTRDFIDYNQQKTVSILKYDNQLYKTSTPFDSLPKPEKHQDKTQNILGFDCQYATFSSFSNKIEVWYTTKAKAKGTPYKSYIPDADALVLKVIINETYEYVAQSIEKIKTDAIQSFPVNESEEVNAAKLEEFKIRLRYVTLPVFKEQNIYFDPSLAPSQDKSLKIDSTYHFSNGSIILKKVKLPEIWKEGAQVFAKVTGYSNGDAYDRVGSVFILQQNDKPISMLTAFQNGLDTLPVCVDNNGDKYQGIISTNNYDTPIELMRFATPFGVKHYNTLSVINNYPWKTEATYNAEVTQLIPEGQDEITIGVFIGNYDKGGHKVSLELNFYPLEEKEKTIKKWIKPLFYTVNIMEMSGQNYGRLFNNDTLTLNFEMAEELENAQLLYTSTGHGGWGGGDEYNPKQNRIFIDGVEIYKVIPWRTDCATYRLYSPASGNFKNGLSSSDYSRSNWCPGAVTPPYVIQLEKLKPGKHELKVVIDQGDQEGNSFSHWCVSGVLLGEIHL